MKLIRIILTCIITAAIVLLGFSYISGQSPDILNYIKQKFSTFPDERSQANISFSMSTNEKPNININVENVNISVTPLSCDIKMTNGEISTTRPIELNEYKGKLVVNGTKLILNGTFNEIQTDGISIEIKENRIEGSIIFSNLSIGELFIKDFRIKMTGEITARDSTIQVSNKDVILKLVRGRFSFGDEFSINGFVKELSIPDSGIMIKN